jgi:uncharacterized membrane protein YgcG
MEPTAATATRTNAAPRAAWRFSIRHILLWTAAVGLACVALRNASAVWVGMAQAAVLLTLATAILLIIFRRGAAQAYWIGFALFGGLYTLLLLVGWISTGMTNQFVDHPFRPYNLATTKASTWAYNQLVKAGALHIEQQVLGSGSMGGMGGMAGYSGDMMSGYGGGQYGGGPMGGAVDPYGNLGGPATVPVLVGPNLEEFNNVAHSLWTLLIAVAGGCLGRWLYATRPETKPDRSSSGTSP